MTSSTYLDALAEYGPGGFRIFTTGHDNLARSHPKSAYHSYFFANFTNTAKGNLWNPDWLGGPGGSHTGAPASQIVTPAAYKFMINYLAARGMNVLPHVFLDAQSGASEGYQNPHAPGFPVLNPALQDLQWYVDPDPRDINGNPLPIGGTVIAGTLIIDIASLVRSAVPRTVNNQILLDRAGSSAGAADPIFRSAIIGYTGLGGFRWPGFGGGTEPLFHFNQPHTYNFTAFPTLTRGNSWDPLYNLSDASPLSTIISLDDFTLICDTVPGVVPHLIFNWRGSIGAGYRPPTAYQLDINDIPISPAIAASMTPDQWMKLHNRRMLKRFIARSGIVNPIVNMGGEDWTHWSDEPDDGVGSILIPVQWTLPDPNGTNKFNYIASRQAEYITDLKSYAISQGWAAIKYCVGFTEAINGGTGPQPWGGDIAMLPGTVTNYRNHFIASLNANVPAGASLFGCTLHLRKDWTQFLLEDELTFSFFVPAGKGTLKEIRNYVISTASSLGFTVDFYPLENGVGQPNSAYSGVEMAEWQAGLAAAQYMMELVAAGYNYADAYLGFTTDYTNAGTGHAAGFDPSWASTGRTSGIDPSLTIHSQYYARRLVGAPLANTPSVVNVTSTETQLPILCYKWPNAGGGVRIGLLVMNKRATSRGLTIPVSGIPGNRLQVLRVQRYSQTETTAPDLATSSVSVSGTTISFTAAPYSLTYIEASQITALDYKILENKRIIKEFMDVGYPLVVFNVGGEDWAGLGDLSEPPNIYPPWDESGGDPDSNNKFAWIASIINAQLVPLDAFRTSQGYGSRVKFAAGFLESAQSGNQFPLDLPTIIRNTAHLDQQVALYGNKLHYVTASMHYRGNWSRFLNERQMQVDGTQGLRISFPIFGGTAPTFADADFPGAISGSASYQDAAKWVRIKYGATNPNLRLAGMADSVGDAADITPPDWVGPGHNYLINDKVLVTKRDYYICTANHTSTSSFTNDLTAGKWASYIGEVSEPDWRRGLMLIQMKIEKIYSEMDLSQDYVGMSGNYDQAGFNPSEGTTGMKAGVFTKFPIYHATKFFGPILHRGASVVEVTGVPNDVVQLVLKYNQGGNDRLAVFLVNKKFTGAAGSEVGVAQSVPLTVPVAAITGITNVHRFSETETTNPLVSGITHVTVNTVTVDLAPFASVYFEIDFPPGAVVEPPPSGPLPPQPPPFKPPSNFEWCPDHDDIFLAFMRLLPKGRAWQTREMVGVARDSNLKKMVSALALTWTRFEEDMCRSLDDWFCYSSSTDLDLWEQDYGIPDACDLYNASVCAKVSAEHSISAEALTDMLAANGYSGTGRWLTGDDVEFPGVRSTFKMIVDPALSFAYLANTQLTFQLGEGRRLGTPSNVSQIECMLNRYIPAHCVSSVELKVGATSTDKSVGVSATTTTTIGRSKVKPRFVGVSAIATTTVSPVKKVPTPILVNVSATTATTTSRVKSTLSAESTALFAAMTVQPSSGRKLLIDNAIVALKSGGLWSKLDFLYVLAAHDAQAARINWLNPAQVATVNGSPVFTADRGYQGDAASSAYLGTGINWSSLVKYTQNDACLGVWVQSATSEDNQVIGQPSTNRIAINPRTIAGNATIRLNTGSGNTVAVTTSRGHTVGSRTVAAGYDNYKDGVLIVNTANTSAALTAEEVQLLRHMTKFSSLHVLSAAHGGSSLTGAEIASFNTILTNYMTGVGA